jgi:hypothetical protein
METVAGVILELLISIAVWFVLYPIVWLLSLPLVLTIALFRKGQYKENVSTMLSTVTGWWTELSSFL